LNANPNGRKAVEDGDWCKRTNENDVDLNRNWDDHWMLSMAGDTYGGNKPFSEVEVVAVKDAMASYKPEVFITIHSGTNAMFTPYAYSSDEPAVNEQNMIDILHEINPKYCDCEVGAAGAGVGYLSPGTCLDYAYDKLKIPYTFALEIYSSTQGIPRTSKSSTFLQSQNKAKVSS
jgi:Zinc carboxypeptidase